MNDNKNMDDGIYTLTDENGNEIRFELVGACEFKGAQYYAMIPVEDNEKEDDEFCEYVILKSVIENGEEMLVTIDDDDEFDDVADYFDDMLTQEIDYDEDASEKK
ncbi:MAG: DUF1292 domain-containing protein [Clostridia bacterium]|nr:DUF1292 domain-containing protein [Clostridia bacterium]